MGESLAVTCSIKPEDASVFVSQAALRVGQGVNAIKPKPLMDMKVGSANCEPNGVKKRGAGRISCGSMDGTICSWCFDGTVHKGDKKSFCVLQVSAIGKYCYVVPSENELDFGEQTIVAVGGGGEVVERSGCPRKDFLLKNQSVVPAKFTVR